MRSQQWKIGDKGEWYPFDLQIIKLDGIFNEAYGEKLG